MRMNSETINLTKNCDVDQSIAQPESHRLPGFYIRYRVLNEDKMNILLDTYAQKQVVLLLTETWIAENDH